MTWLVCEQCGGRYINRGGHAEVCPGPRQVVIERPREEKVCDCPPGAWHLKTCDAAYWPEDAA